MIVKIGKRGTDPGNLVRYLANTKDSSLHPGQNLHTDPTVVASSLDYSGPMDKDMVTQLTTDLRMPSTLHPDVSIKDGHIWHVALSANKEDGIISHQTWGSLARDYMQQMGLENPAKSPLRWAAVNHGTNDAGADHVHIAANLIREDGTKGNIWQDMMRSQKIVAGLEVKYGLRVLASRTQNISVRGYTKDDSGRSKDLSLEPSRLQTERLVRAAASAAHSEGQFVKLLEREGLTFVPFQKNGQTTGYSVKDANGYGWAGGKLARDLSLPRLRQSWQEPEKKTNGIAASKELADLKDRIPTASIEELQDISHQLAGALAAASLQVEPLPGQFAAASHQAGAYAQTRTYVWKKKPPALGVGFLLMQAQDPTGPVGKTALMRQLLATYSALCAAQSAQRERTPSMAEPGPEEELMEAGVTTLTMVSAMGVEAHARRKQAKDRNEKPADTPVPEPRDTSLWDRNTFAKYIAADKMQKLREQRALTPAASQDQVDRIIELSKEIGLPADPALLTHLTRDDAVALLGQLEQVPLGEQWKTKPTSDLPPDGISHATGIGPIRTTDDAQAFLNRLERHHEARVLSDVESTELPAVQRSPEPAARTQAKAWEFRPEQQDEPITDSQIKSLQKRGINPAGYTKAEASLIIGGKAKDIEDARKRLRAAGAALTPDNREGGLTAMPDQVRQSSAPQPRKNVNRRI